MSKALVLAAVSTGIQVVGAIGKAKSAREAAEFDAQQLQDQSDLNQLEGVQSELQERQELAIALSTQSAGAAGSGVGVDSGSFKAIQRDSRLKTERNIKNIKLMGQLKTRQFQLGIDQTLKAGQQEAQGAIFSALGSIAGTGMDLAGTGAFSSGGTGVPLPKKKPI